MKGKILGSDGSGGIISGEDGKRYRFDFDHWKNERPPAPGQEVDFDPVSDGKAADVFALQSGMSIDLGAVGGQAKALFNEGANSPGGGQLIAALKEPVFLIAVVVLIASLFLTFAKIDPRLGTYMEFSSGTGSAIPGYGTFKIISLSRFTDYMKLNLNGVADNTLNAQAGSFDAGRQMKGAAETFRVAAQATNILYLCYLVPLAAVALLVQKLRGQKLDLLTFGTGALCVVSFAILFGYRLTVTTAIQKAAGPGPVVNPTATHDFLAHAIGPGMGAYLIFLCGLGLIGISLGLIRLTSK